MVNHRSHTVGRRRIFCRASFLSYINVFSVFLILLIFFHKIFFLEKSFFGLGNSVWLVVHGSWAVSMKRFGFVWKLWLFVWMAKIQNYSENGWQWSIKGRWKGNYRVLATFRPHSIHSWHVSRLCISAGTQRQNSFFPFCLKLIPRRITVRMESDTDRNAGRSVSSHGPRARVRSHWRWLMNDDRRG